MAKIPVVDFSKDDCLKPGTSSWLSARRDVCRALEDIGCFTAILPNKVPKEYANTFFSTFDDLFDFPTSTPEKPFFYATSNSGQRTYGIINGTNPQDVQQFTHLIWPDGNDQFRESADFYAKVLAELDQTVTRMVFENYGVEKYHDDHVRSMFYNLKMIRYEKPEKLDSDVGLKIHTDKNFSTIIHQNHINGLEINTKDDEWVLFDPPPSSIIFIAADGFQVWSNDRIRPCRHRVTLTENVVRYTFGVFSVKKGVIHVPNELVDEDHPLLYKPLNHVEFLMAQRHTGETEYAAKAYCAI
ncbi:hypothetical protein ACFX11_037750 [Malus domestica]